MAALRSALATLSRGSSGSSAFACLGGRGLEINQAFCHAAPLLHPVPAPFLPAAMRNLGCRRFSTGGVREPADKAESGLRMWWKRANLEERTRLLFAYTVVVLGTPTVFVLRC